MKAHHFLKASFFLRPGTYLMSWKERASGLVIGGAGMISFFFNEKLENVSIKKLKNEIERQIYIAAQRVGGSTEYLTNHITNNPRSRSSP